VAGENNMSRIRLVVACALVALPAAAQVVGTKAGGFVGDGLPAAQSALLLVQFFASDGNGNLYIADAGYNRIRRVGPDGIITTVAGVEESGYSGDGGLATRARLNNPQSVAADAAGNLYIADRFNCALRQVGQGGIIQTISGGCGYSGDGGPTGAASFIPYSVVARGSDLYVVERANSVVRRIHDGMVSTVAGTGQAGFSGDRGRAALARLNRPQAIAFDGAGGFYIADSGNARIRYVDPNGMISTYVGKSGGGRFFEGVSSTAAPAGSPSGLTLTPHGDLLYVGAPNNRTRRVSAGRSYTFAGLGVGYDGDGNPPLLSQFNFPTGIGLGADGALLIADGYNSRLRRLDPSTNLFSTFAGGPHGDGGPATSASLNQVSGISFDDAGNLYIVDRENHLIRRVDPSGTITRYAGLGGPTGLPFDPPDLDEGQPREKLHLLRPDSALMDHHGNFYVGSNWHGTLLRIDAATGLAHSIPVASGPFAMALGADDTIYWSDDAQVFKASPEGVVSLVAGDGQGGFGGDGGPALTAQMQNMWAVAVAPDGTLYIADSDNNRVRRVRGGIIDTVVGTGDPGSDGDGGPATQATIAFPTGLALDSAGNLYLADNWCSCVRKVDPSGIISTLAGGADFGYINGVRGSRAAFSNFVGLAADARDNIYVADVPRVRVIATNPRDAGPLLLQALEKADPARAAGGLRAHLSAAQAALDAGRLLPARGELLAFANQAQALSGKALTAEQGERLADTAQAIIEMIDLPGRGSPTAHRRVHPATER